MSLRSCGLHASCAGPPPGASRRPPPFRGRWSKRHALATRPALRASGSLFPPPERGRAIAYDFFAAFRLVIPDGERSEPIRDPSIPAFGNQGEAGVLGSRLSRLTAVRPDGKSKGRVICDSPA